MKEFKFKNKQEVSLFCESLFAYAKQLKQSGAIIDKLFVDYLQRVLDFRLDGSSDILDRYVKANNQKFIDDLRIELGC